MRAVVYERFGGPEVLEVRNWPRPAIGEGQLLVSVRAAGVNPVDAQNRADGAWAQIQPPVIPGYDFSGVVDAVGARADGWMVGDEVFGALPVRVTRSGSYAEYVAVDAGIVVAKPDGVGWIEAAATTVAGCTAHEALRRLRLESAEWLLICGAGGGVGTFAVQIGAAAGARVIAIASARHHDLLIQLGAEACVDYTAEDPRDAVRRIAGEVDVLADFVGGRTLERMLPVVRERGRAVEIAGIEGDVEEVIDRNLELHGVLFNPVDPEPLRAVREELAAGRLRPAVSDVLALEQAAEAHRRIEAGHQQGKIVLEVS